MQDLKELVLLLRKHNIYPLKHLVGSSVSKLLAYCNKANDLNDANDLMSIALRFNGQKAGWLKSK